jgi:hypothetical protein
MSDARWRLGFGTVAALPQAYFIATAEHREGFRTWVASFCLFALLALMGGYGLVLRSRSARSTVYATENGAHDPQDTGDDQ